MIASTRADPAPERYPAPATRSKFRRLRCGLAAAALTTAFAAPPANADPQADAAWIVAQTLTPEMLSAAFDALGPLLVSALENELRINGIGVSDMEAFKDIVIAYIQQEMPGIIEAELADHYVMQFSPQELADITTFYRSESGQSLLRKTPQIMRELTAIGERAGVVIGQSMSGRPFLEALQEEGIRFTRIPQ